MFTFLKNLIKRNDHDKWLAETEKKVFRFKADCRAEAQNLLTVNSLISALLDEDYEGDASEIANNWIDSGQVHIRENNSYDNTIDYFLAAKPESEMEEPGENAPVFALAQKYIEENQPQAKELDGKMADLKTRVGKELQSLIDKMINKVGGPALAMDVLAAVNIQNQAFVFEMKQEGKHLVQAELPTATEELHKKCALLSDGGGMFKNKKTVIEEIGKTAYEIARIKREILRRRYAVRFFNWLQVKIQTTAYNVRLVESLFDYICQRNNLRLAEMFDLANSTSDTEVEVSAKPARLQAFIASLPQSSLLSVTTMEPGQVSELLQGFAMSVKADGTLQAEEPAKMTKL